MSSRRSAPRAGIVVLLFAVVSFLSASGCGRSDLDADDLFGEGGSVGVGGGTGEGGTGTGSVTATGGRTTGGRPGNTGGRIGTGGVGTGGRFGTGGVITGGAGGRFTGGAGGVITGGAGGRFTGGAGGVITGGAGGRFTGGAGGVITGGAGGRFTGGAGGVITGGAGGTLTGGAGGRASGGAGGSVTGGAGGGPTGGAGGVASGGAGGRASGGTPATGGAPNDCASTCSGCCDALGRCLKGSEASACGASGAKCLDCGSSGFGCVNGVCQGPPPTCGPANCGGCCDTLGRCRLGSELDACGISGGKCTSCSATSTACTAGKCVGAPPPCGPSTCGGCCTATGVCVTGTANGACGTTGESCENCGASGRTCNQPGSYCTFVPTCSATTCPTGCCDDSGVCRNGRADATCGTSGQKCLNCGTSNQHCASSGFCYAGAHCGPDTCGGCCTANGQCVEGANNARCGLYGALCDNCSNKGQTCQAGACGAAGATCPAPYGGCNPGVLTTPPAVSQSCSDADLDAVAKGCAGAQSGPACRAQLATLLRNSPACFDCLQPFTGQSGVAACLASFMNASCNHDLTCSLSCASAACGQCTSGGDTCQDQAFTASGTCRSYVNGNYCATAAFGGPGAFCDLERIGDVGAWLEGVGAYYCSN